MQKKTISLDCDGVIADVGEFLKQSFREHLGREISPHIINSFYRNELKEYAKRENFDYHKVSSFFKNYPEDLFKNLSCLDVVEGASEGIEKLKRADIELIINSYRPSQHNELKQNTKNITKNWLKKNNIYLPVNTTETEGEKYALICDKDIIAHVDDSIKVSRRLKSLSSHYTFNPILFEQYYEIITEKDRKEISVVENWKELTDFLLGLCNKEKNKNV